MRAGGPFVRMPGLTGMLTCPGHSHSEVEPGAPVPAVHLPLGVEWEGLAGHTQP